MLSTNKLRSIYAKIQTLLFYMIPEKWEKICLYASVIKQVNNIETGEMFFYYYPSGLLKKNPINVYEIPLKFNLDEEEYSKLVDKLYRNIIELREAFKESTEEKMWTNLTITIENFKFNVEYAYDDLLKSKFTSEDRHIIWKCKYLDYPVERLTKKDKKMLEEYYNECSLNKKKTKIYTEGMYKKKVHNIVEYNREDEYRPSNYNDEEDYKIDIEKQEETIKKSAPTYEVEGKRKLDRYELYKIKQAEKKRLEKEEKEDNMKNQILKI